MNLDIDYVSIKSGTALPVQIQVEKVEPRTIAEFQTYNKNRRNQWCTWCGDGSKEEHKKKKPCSKYGQRPCCPPNCKLFSELKQRKHFYLVRVSVLMKDYFSTYPNIANCKAHDYFGMQGSHRLTRSIQNKIVSQFSGQTFRVGGCDGCQFKKTGRCKRFAPSLEATGIRVVKLAESVMGIKFEWWKDGKLMTITHSIGGIYTDELIKPSEFKRIIKWVCNN